MLANNVEELFSLYCTEWGNKKYELSDRDRKQIVKTFEEKAYKMNALTKANQEKINDLKNMLIAEISI